MRTLVIPPAAQRDENAIQMLSAWIAENGRHCTMNVGMWHDQGQSEAKAWGILLADVIRHLGNAIEHEWGIDAEVTVADIVDSLLNELDQPSSQTRGEFHPGHS